MRALFAIVCVLVAAQAAADLPYQPRISWSPPTEFTDNTPLDPLTDLAEYRLYCTPQMPTDPQVIAAAPPYEWEAPAGFFLPGDYTCYMTAVATPAKGGLESAPSQTKSFTVEVGKPRPIVIFDIN